MTIRNVCLNIFFKYFDLLIYFDIYMLLVATASQMIKIVAYQLINA